MSDDRTKMEKVADKLADKLEPLFDLVFPFLPTTMMGSFLLIAIVGSVMKVLKPFEPLIERVIIFLLDDED